MPNPGPAPERLPQGTTPVPDGPPLRPVAPAEEDVDVTPGGIQPALGDD